MISERVRTYIERTLLASGFTVLDSGIAYRLMRDNWPTRQAAAFDFSLDVRALIGIAEARGAALYVADVRGIEAPVRVLAMSDDELEARVQRMTGAKLSNLRPWKAEAVPAPSTATVVPAKEDAPPAHPCDARREWFESRGLRDPMSIRPAQGTAQAMDTGVFGGCVQSKPRF